MKTTQELIMALRTESFWPWTTVEIAKEAASRLEALERKTKDYEEALQDVLGFQSLAPARVIDAAKEALSKHATTGQGE